MPLDFPSTPALNEVYSFDGKSWKWNGAAWETYNDNLGVDFVETINGITGAVSLSGGTDISVVESGKTITINYTGSSTSNSVTSFNGKTGAVQGVSSFQGKTGSVGISAGYSKGEGITWSMVGNTYAFGVHYTTAVGTAFTTVNDFDVLLLERKNSGQMFRIYAKDFAANLPYPPTTDAGPPGSGTNFLVSGNQYVTYAELVQAILDGAVTSFNGLTGNVYGVSSVNGFTGDVTISTVDFVDGGTFAA